MGMLYEELSTLVSGVSSHSAFVFPSVPLDEAMVSFNFQKYLCYVQMMLNTLFGPIFYKINVKFLKLSGGRTYLLHHSPYLPYLYIFLIILSSWKKKKSRKEEHKRKLCPSLIKQETPDSPNHK